jgi:hypothetical protein
MSFQPVVPLGGYVGWKFLQRTLESQRAAHASAPEQKRATEHFREKIGSVTSAAQLVSDRQLLSVALGAFGLDDDLPNRAFIEKVLTDGTARPEALANRLVDKRYRALSEAFGFGGLGLPRTGLTGFADEIVAAYEARQFEIDVGEQDGDLRIALALDRDLGDIARGGLSEDGKWFAIMGQPPLRKAFETAFGLPRSFGSLDIDDQLNTFRDKARAAFGDDAIGQFADPEKREELVRLFLLRADLKATQQSLGSASVALSILSQTAGRPSLF